MKWNRCDNHWSSGSQRSVKLSDELTKWTLKVLGSMIDLEAEVGFDKYWGVIRKLRKAS